MVHEPQNPYTIGQPHYGHACAARVYPRRCTPLSRSIHSLGMAMTAPCCFITAGTAEWAETPTSTTDLVVEVDSAAGAAATNPA